MQDCLQNCWEENCNEVKPKTELWRKLQCRIAQNRAVQKTTTALSPKPSWRENDVVGKSNRVAGRKTKASDSPTGSLGTKRRLRTAQPSRRTQNEGFEQPNRVVGRKTKASESSTGSPGAKRRLRKVQPGCREQNFNAVKRKTELGESPNDVLLSQNRECN